MSEEKKEKELLVNVPIFLRMEKESKFTTMTERINFLYICQKIIKYCVGPIIALSLALTLFTLHAILNQYNFPETLLVYSIFIAGITNLLSGLLLLAKD